MRDRVDVVVLLYLDGTDVYRVLAYPTGLVDSIDWYPKNKGPNLQGIMIFDPRKLPKEFVFKSIDQFKRQFAKRFAV